jgi:hypothetical protein
MLVAVLRGDERAHLGASSMPSPTLSAWTRS